MSDRQQAPLTREELDAELGAPLPAKEVVSLLDLDVNLDVALDLVAPIDLAVAANANVAAPIEAAVSANAVSFGSSAGAFVNQEVLIDQAISGEAIAHAPQDVAIDQSDDTVGETEPPPPAPVPETGDPLTALTQGGLLNINVDVALDADLAAPIAGAVAANANAAAPIDAAVAANVLSFDSVALAEANQTALIYQSLDGVTASATADQDTTITQ